jgi:hypothetical protein
VQISFGLPLGILPYGTYFTWYATSMVTRAVVSQQKPRLILDICYYFKTSGLNISRVRDNSSQAKGRGTPKIKPDESCIASLDVI